MELSDFFIIPQRIILAIMGLLAMVISFTMRISLTFIITEITVKHNGTIDGRDILVCTKTKNNFLDKVDIIEFHTSEMNEDNLLNWNEQLQGTISSSFYWGYVIAHIPGGLLADKFGGKWALSFSVLVSSLLTLLTPITIKSTGSTGLIVLRTIMGLAQGTLYPALTVLLAQWIPLCDRSKVGTLVYGGRALGGVFGTGVAGIIVFHTGSWELLFYIWGVTGILWFPIFILLCYNGPNTHPFIKNSEKEYLETEILRIRRTNLPPIPIKLILTSLPVFALISAQSGHDWGYFTLIDTLPQYLADVLQLSIKENGLCLAISYLAMCFFSMMSAFVCDFLISGKHMSITNARKLWTMIAGIGPAIFIIAASYAACNKGLAIFFFIMSMGIMGFWYAGTKLNAIDLSPHYSGTLMAISNGVGAINGIIVPIVIGTLTTHPGIKEWRVAFWITFWILVTSTLIFFIWGSGEVQPWNRNIVEEEQM